MLQQRLIVGNKEGRHHVQSSTNGAGGPAPDAARHRRRSANGPPAGPGIRTQATRSPISGHSRVVSSIETMVMAKPIAFWKASALPTLSGAQARADRAEKRGESATTLAPHSSISAASSKGGQPVARG